MSCLIHGDSKLIGAALDDDTQSNIEEMRVQSLFTVLVDTYKARI